MYITTNKTHTVLYTGVTSDLVGRIYDHKTKRFKGFTARYNVDKLVYYECYGNISDAIAREKQIKAGSRKDKLKLINEMNPNWKDLSDDWQ